MNIETGIQKLLWDSIQNSYQTGNYCHAITDSIQVLSNALREKSGCDEDGVSLVGKALGGNPPILRINRFQTASEQDAQRGLEHIIRGIYIGIRNPRSHEQIIDSKQTADAVIFFIDYILGILDNSKEAFSINGFLSRVFDPHFDNSARYVELLVAEIPKNKYVDVWIELFRRNNTDDVKNFELVSKEILKHLSINQIDLIVSTVSDEFKEMAERTDIRLSLQMLPPVLWPKLKEISRLRIENVLLNSIKAGRIRPDGKLENPDGALGTWAKEHLSFFQKKDDVINCLINKLTGENSEKLYVFNFFLTTLPEIVTDEHNKIRVIKLICKIVEEDIKNTTSRAFDIILKESFWSLPDDWRTDINAILPIYEIDPPF